MTIPTPRRVLITGAAGFLGSRLVRSYVAQGWLVRAMVHRRLSGSWYDDASRPPNLDVVQGDVTELTPAGSDVFAGQDLVIHAAALIRTSTLDDRVRQRKVNVDGTARIVEACQRHGVARLVYVSTTAALGVSCDQDVPVDENHDYNLSHLDVGYDLTKHAAEQVVLGANGSLLETLVASPGFVFGWDGTSFRGADVLHRSLSRSVVLCTEGGLSVVHVDDVVTGIHLVAERGTPGERYILSGENVSFGQIAETVRLLAGNRCVVVRVPGAVTDLALELLESRVGRASGLRAPLHLDRRYAHRYYSSDKARRELGYAPRRFSTIVEEALRHRSSL